MIPTPGFFCDDITWSMLSWQIDFKRVYWNGAYCRPKGPWRAIWYSARHFTRPLTSFTGSKTYYLYPMYAPYNCVLIKGAPLPQGWYEFQSGQPKYERLPFSSTLCNNNAVQVVMIVTWLRSVRMIYKVSFCCAYWTVRDHCSNIFTSDRFYTQYDDPRLDLIQMW